MSRVADAIAVLEARADGSGSAGIARFGIVTADRVIGMSVASIRDLARQLGRDHALAEALWPTRIYEARLLAAFVDDPALVTPEQMDRCARDFDNWGLCDTLCFHLYDRTPHAFAMVDRWADDPAEFVKRSAFALLASLALHDKKAPDAPFLERLALIESAAGDPRNFVRKGVNWALRAIGGRKSPALRAAARDTALRLAESSNKTARWNGRDALRQFAKADARAQAASSR